MIKGQRLMCVMYAALYYAIVHGAMLVISSAVCGKPGAE